MTTQFEVGDGTQIKVHISSRDVELFAALSGDKAPLHTDASFAQGAGFKGEIVHGAFLVALLSRMIGMEFPGSGAVLERVDVFFRQPCYAPCDLTITAKVRQISEAVASVILDISFLDETEAVVASGKTWHRILGYSTGNEQS